MGDDPKVVVAQVPYAEDGTLPDPAPDETRLFSVRVVEVPVDGLQYVGRFSHAYQVVLNGQPCGPKIVGDAWLANEIAKWFCGYLGEQVERVVATARQVVTSIGVAHGPEGVLPTDQAPPGAGEESGG